MASETFCDFALKPQLKRNMLSSIQNNDWCNQSNFPHDGLATLWLSGGYEQAEALKSVQCWEIA